MKNICIQEKFIIRLIFNLGLVSTRFRTTRPFNQNLAWQRFIFNKHMTSVSLKFEPAIGSRDTGQLTLACMSSIKEGHYKPRLYVSVMAAILRDSVVFVFMYVRAHEQYR